MYVLAPNQTVETYPYSIGDLRKANPDTSFPKNPTDELLAGYNVFPVADTPEPEYNRLLQTLEEGSPQFNGGQWARQWIVRDATAEEIAWRAEQIQQVIVRGTQKRLDDFAKTKNYDGILSACTYATSPTVAFAAEGQYCVNKRDATWSALYQVLAEVQAGTRAMPTSYEDIESELPALDWGDV